jgi:hypothetical protein
MPTLSVNRKRAGSLDLAIAKRRHGRIPNLKLERTACMGRRSAKRECSTPCRPMQAAVQRQR